MLFDLSHYKAISNSNQRRSYHLFGTLNADLRLFLLLPSYFPIILAGTPTAVELSRISVKTRALAPILTLFPIATLPKTEAPHPTRTLSPSLGKEFQPCLLLPILLPIVTPCSKVKFFPATVPLPITIPEPC